MRKRFVFLCVAGLIAFSASSLFAGGADNKTNWSAEYIRTLNRNAATDSADIVMYNPAGVMKMADGLYGNLSGHYVDKYYNNEINGVDFDQDKGSIVPGLFAIYKHDRWAGIFGVSNVVGGGKVEFKDGNATTNLVGVSLIGGANRALAGAGVPSSFFYSGITQQNLDGEQTGLGYTLGGAYKINDIFSLALAARYVSTKRKLDGTITVSATNPFPGVNNPLTELADVEEDAKGWGGVLGVNIAPTEQWNIGIRYDTKVNLDFDQDVNQDTLGILPALGYIDGGERERNLPAILALGVSYQVTPEIRLETDFTYYLNESAGFDDIAGTPRDESAVDNGFDLGIACEYAFNEKVKGSVGYLYTKTGVDAENMTPELPELDAHSLGAGVVWEVNPKLALNFGLGHVFYQSESFVSMATGANIKYEKDINFLAFGIQYKFM